MKNIFSVLKILTTRLHLIWVLFFVLLFGSVFTYVSALYEKYSENQLPSGHIELVMDTTRYQLGETVEFTVVNHFPTTVYVTNQCHEEPLNVFRWESEKWVQLHDTALSTDSECYTQERNIAIPPEGSRGYDFSNWPNLFSEPGVYRIVLTVDHYDDLPFQDFVILKPAEVVEIMEEPIYKKVPAPVVPTTPVVVETAPVMEEPEIVVEEAEEEEEENEYEDEEEYEEEDDD